LLRIAASTIYGNCAFYEEVIRPPFNIPELVPREGGGICHEEGLLTITDSTIHGNTAANRGGGIFSFGASTTQTQIVNSTISGNTASSYGGGVYNDKGLTLIQHSTITGNTAPVGYGSGVASLGDTDTETDVTHTIISGNTVGEDVAIA
jgi:hypothetical protein